MSSSNRNNIIGCFVSSVSVYHDDDEATQRTKQQKGELFRSYIWGDLGISDPLKVLPHSRYGKDLKLILLEFHVLPLLEELGHLRELGYYRKKEKSIGAPIIVHDRNFFDRSELERRAFLRESILVKLDLIVAVVTRNKLDTDLKSLRSDVDRILS